MASHVPPRIPGSQVLSTLDVETAKINTLFGDVLYKLNTWKGSVTAATTANIVSMIGLMTIDGVVLVSGDTVLVKDQSTATQNGLYVVSAGAWYRPNNLPAGSFAAGVAVFVNEGTLNKDKVFVCTNDSGTTASPTDVVGTDALVFASLVAGGVVIADKVANVTQITPETTAVVSNGPAGTITSVTSTTLAVDASYEFTVTNSSVLADSLVFLQLGAHNAAEVATLTVHTLASGSFKVQVTNVGTAPFVAAENIAFSYLVV
jgi:hypothetical protein